MSSILYVSLDIGGTLAKVAFASEALNFPPLTVAEIKGRKFQIHLSRFNDVEESLKEIEKQIALFDTVKLSVTGGGATLFQKQIHEKFHKAEITTSINEFQACTLGFNFLKQGAIQLNRGRYVKKGANDGQFSQEKVTLDKCELPLFFMCIGSGVSMHKIELGEGGFKKSEVPLEGTCLGGAYIFGLIRLISQQSDSSKIIELIKTNDTYSKICDENLTNLMQLGIEQSRILQASTIVVTGSLLSVKPSFPFFEKAMSLSNSPGFQRSIISLGVYQGYLGNLGLLYSLISKQ